MLCVCKIVFNCVISASMVSKNILFIFVYAWLCECMYGVCEVEAAWLAPSIALIDPTINSFNSWTVEHCEQSIWLPRYFSVAFCFVCVYAWHVFDCTNNTDKMFRCAYAICNACSALHRPFTVKYYVLNEQFGETERYHIYGYIEFCFRCYRRFTFISE